MPKKARITREFAESLAVKALSFLAQDSDRLGQFLATSGIGPDMIRTAAANPDFLSGILDHIVSDEPLLLAFAADAAVGPEEVVQAQAALSGRRWEREVP
jgi:Protein of unknown function (DUF3572)